MRESCIFRTFGVSLISNGQGIFIDFQQLADSRMVFGGFRLCVILEPVVVGPLEVLKLDAAVVLVAEQFQDSEDEGLMTLFWQVELDQLEDRVQLVALRLREELGDGFQFGQSDDGESIGCDELMEGLLSVEDVSNQSQEWFFGVC